MIKSLKLPLICIIILIIIIVINFTLKGKVSETKNKASVPEKTSNATDYSFYEPVNSWGETKSTTYKVPGGIPIIGSGECKTYRFESLVENNFTRPNTENLFQDLVEGECRQVPETIIGGSIYNDQDEITARYVTRGCSGGNPNAVCTTETGVVINSGESITYTEKCVSNIGYDSQIGTFSFNYLLGTNQSGVSGLDASCKCIGISTIKIPQNLQLDGLDFYETLGIVERSSDISNGSSTFPVTFKNVFCNPNDPAQRLKLTRYIDPEGSNTGISGIYGKIEFRGLNSYLDIDFGDEGGLDIINFNGTSYGGTSFYFSNKFSTEFNNSDTGEITQYPVYSGQIINNKFVNDSVQSSDLAQVLINFNDNSPGISGFPQTNEDITIFYNGSNYEENSEYYIVNLYDENGNLLTDPGWIKITSIITLPQKSDLVFRKIENGGEGDEGINWILMPSLNMKKFTLTTETRANYITSNWDSMEYECSYPGSSLNINNSSEAYIGISRIPFTGDIFTNIENDYFNDLCTQSTGRDCKTYGWPQEVTIFENTVPSWYTEQVYDWNSQEQQTFLQSGKYVTRDLIELYNKNIPTYSVGNYFCPLDYWVTGVAPANMIRPSNADSADKGPKYNYVNAVTPPSFLNFYKPGYSYFPLNDTNYFSFGRTYYYDNSNYSFTYYNTEYLDRADIDYSYGKKVVRTPYITNVLKNILNPGENFSDVENYELNPIELLTSQQNRILSYYDFIEKHLGFTEADFSPVGKSQPSNAKKDLITTFYNLLDSYISPINYLIPFIGYEIEKISSPGKGEPLKESPYYPIQISSNLNFPSVTCEYSSFYEWIQTIGLLNSYFPGSLVSKPGVWTQNSEQNAFWKVFDNKSLFYPQDRSANSFKFEAKLCNNFNTGAITLNGLVNTTVEDNSTEVYKIKDQPLSNIFSSAYNNFNYSFPVSDIIRYPPYLLQLKSINTKGSLNKLILDPNIGGVSPTTNEKKEHIYVYNKIDVGTEFKLVFNYSRIFSPVFGGDLNSEFSIGGFATQNSFYEYLAENGYSPVWFPNQENVVDVGSCVFPIKRTGMNINRLNLLYKPSISNHVWNDETSNNRIREFSTTDYENINPTYGDKRPGLYIGQQVTDGIGIFEVVPTFLTTFKFSDDYFRSNIPQIKEIFQQSSGIGLSTSKLGQITSIGTITNESNGNLIFGNTDIGLSFPNGELIPNSDVHGTSFGVCFSIVPGTNNIPIIYPEIKNSGENYKIGDSFVYNFNNPPSNNTISFTINQKNLTDQMYSFFYLKETDSQDELIPVFQSSVVNSSVEDNKILKDIQIINYNFFNPGEVNGLKVFQLDLTDPEITPSTGSSVQVGIIRENSKSKLYKWNEPSPNIINSGLSVPDNNLFDDEKSEINNYNVFIKDGLEVSLKIPKQKGFRTSPQQLVYGGELVPFPGENGKKEYKKFTYKFQDLLNQTTKGSTIQDRIVEIFLSNKNSLTGDTNINYLKSLQYNNINYEFPSNSSVGLNQKLILGRFIPCKTMDYTGINILNKIFKSTDSKSAKENSLKYFGDMTSAKEAQEYVDNTLQQTFTSYTQCGFIEYGTDLNNLKPNPDSFG